MNVAPAGLRARVVRGMAWKLASRVLMEGSRLAVAVVLARLLAPHEYGLAAMVLVFQAFVLVFSDVALGAALVQRRSLSERDRSTVFWTGACVGGFFTLVGIALAGPVAAFYGEPEVRPLFAALSLSFIVTALGTTQSALLTRELDFRALELRLMAATVAGAVVGISLAVGGFGAWAIVAQQLAIAAVGTALLWLASPWRPQLVYSLASLRALGGFSLAVFAQRLVYYTHRSADRLLVGRVLGPSALGAYTIAFNIALVPFSRIAGPVQEVLFPAFARLQDDRERLARVWLRAIRMVGSISIPSLVGLALVAPELVAVLLGDRWAAAVPALRLLAWVGLLQSLQALNGDVLQALGRTGTLVRLTAIFAAVHVAAFAAGVSFGIVGVAAGYAAATTLVEPLIAWRTARAVGVPLRSLGAALGGIVQATALMALAVAAARELLLEAGAPAALVLAASAAVGAAVYLGACAWRAPEVPAELRRLRARGAEV